MHALLFQNWVTLSTTPDFLTITQGATSWLDVAAFEDLVFFLEVKLQSGVATVNYQTAPVPEEAAFVTMLPSVPLVAGVRADRVLASNAQVPVARHLRWQLTGSAISATFRIWVAAYSLEG